MQIFTELHNLQFESVRTAWPSFGSWHILNRPDRNPYFLGEALQFRFVRYLANGIGAVVECFMQAVKQPVTDSIRIMDSDTDHLDQRIFIML